MLNDGNISVSSTWAFSGTFSGWTNFGRMKSTTSDFFFNRPRLQVPRLLRSDGLGGGKNFRAAISFFLSLKKFDWAFRRRWGRRRWWRILCPRGSVRRRRRQRRRCGRFGSVAWLTAGAGGRRPRLFKTTSKRSIYIPTVLLRLLPHCPPPICSLFFFFQRENRRRHLLKLSDIVSLTAIPAGLALTNRLRFASNRLCFVSCHIVADEKKRPLSEWRRNVSTFLFLIRVIHIPSTFLRSASSAFRVLLLICGQHNSADYGKSAQLDLAVNLMRSEYSWIVPTWQTVNLTLKSFFFPQTLSSFVNGIRQNLSKSNSKRCTFLDFRLLSTSIYWG